MKFGDEKPWEVCYVRETFDVSMSVVIVDHFGFADRMD
jgi:hypothetical protein